jgi:hypothetical protein
LIEEDIKIRLSSNSICYHLIQNLLSSCPLSENIRQNVCKYNLPVILCGCGIWSLILSEQEHHLLVFENGAEENIWNKEE